LRLNGIKGSAPAFAVQCSLQNNDAIVISVELSQLISGLRLRLHNDTPPATFIDVFSQGIARDSIECSNLNKSELGTNFEHPTTDNIVEFQPTKKCRLKQLTRTISRTLDPVAELGQNHFQ
jgi:hypothetical protein